MYHLKFKSNGIGMFKKIKSIVVVSLVMAAHNVCGMYSNYPALRVHKEEVFKDIASYKEYVNELLQGNKERLHAAVIVSLRQSGGVLVYEYDEVANDQIHHIQVPPAEDISIHVAVSYNQ